MANANQNPQVTDPKGVQTAPSKGKMIRVENTREHALHLVRQLYRKDDAGKDRPGTVEQAVIPRGGVPRGAEGADAFRNGEGTVGEDLLTHLLTNSATVKAWHRNGWLVIVDDDFSVPKYTGSEVKKPRLPLELIPR